MCDESREQLEFESDIGWRWLFPPSHRPATATRIVWAGDGVVLMAEPHETRGTRVHLVYAELLPKADCEYRVVFFDAEGKRYLLKSAMRGSSDDENHSIEITMCYCWGEEDGTPSYENLAYLGVEVKTK